MVPDQVIYLLVQENIELACQAIEKAAMDRAVIDVDDGFATAYEYRRRHREVSSALPSFGNELTGHSVTDFGLALCRRSSARADPMAGSARSE